MSSASAKLEKQASQEAADPLKQVLIMIEHKKRNLEKRKVKLERYREEQKSGKELKLGQVLAVDMYKEVCMTLDFATDVLKQVQIIGTENAKLQKKQQRKEQLERNQGELSRIRELLIIQDVMQNMGNDLVRADFLAGAAGAVTLSCEELTFLDELYPLLVPKREDGTTTTFAQQVATAADHFLALIEGRSKEMVGCSGCTYLTLRDLLQRINSCGYFEQNVQKLAIDCVIQEGDCAEEVPEVPLVDPAIIEKKVEVSLPVKLPPQQVAPPSLPPQLVEPQPIVAPVPAVVETVSYFSAPVVAVAPPPQFPALPPQQQQQPMPPTIMPVQQQQQQQQIRQQQRPISEVIGQANSSFNFLQESQLEMESPSPPNVDLAIMLQPFPASGLPPGRNPAAPAASAVPQPDFHQSIPTQTFTNQSFSVMAPQAVIPVVSIPSVAPVAAAHIPAFSQLPPGTAAAYLPAVEPPPPIPMPPRNLQEEQGKMMQQPQAGNVGPPSFAQAATYSSQAQAPKPQGFVPGAPPGFSPQQKLPPQQQSQFQPIPSMEQAAEQERAEEQQSSNWADAGHNTDGGGDDYNAGPRSGGYRGRGGRGSRSRGNTNGFSGRSRGGQQNGGVRSGGYQGRQEGGGNDRGYENGLPNQRDYSSNFKRGGGGSPRDHRDHSGPVRDNRDNRDHGGQVRERDNNGPMRDRDNSGTPNRGGQGYRGSNAPFRGGPGNPGTRYRGGNAGGGNPAAAASGGNPRPQQVKQ